MSRIHDALEKARRERGKTVVPSDEPEGDRPQTVSEGHSLAGLADHFRQECDSLRSAIEAALPDRTQRVIMFTSSVRQEGCTTLVASLGYSLAARAGMKVCLIDMNIKWPGLGDLMGLKPHAGLTDVVGRDLDLQMALRSTATPNLHVLLAGNTPLISSEVFRSSQTRSLMQKLKSHHQYVLVDAPAVMPMPEVSMLCKDTDGVVLVARANKTDRTVVQKARDLLATGDANLLGVVLNRRRYVIPEFLYQRL